MAFEQREGGGALFKNDKKGNEKAPDYKGDILLGGVTYELAGWLKDSARGKFLSIMGKVKGEKKDYAKPKPAEDDGFGNMPF